MSVVWSTTINQEPPVLCSFSNEAHFKPVKTKRQRPQKARRQCDAKLAPRSSLQFKIGPQFSHTYIIHNVLTSNGNYVAPLISARIDRGFEQVDGDWIGYKRNYFTLVASFEFQNMHFNEFLSETFTVLDSSKEKEFAVKYFALRLVSKSNEDGSAVSLVQHTAKRDRGPQFAPPAYPSVPGELPNHCLVKESANVRNYEKIAKLNKIFYFNRSTQAHEANDISALIDYPDDQICKVARYERIQFASSINYRKPASNNKRFKLYVELLCVTMDNREILVAVTETPPLIIRGRSPSNYKPQTETTESSPWVGSNDKESTQSNVNPEVLSMSTGPLGPVAMGSPVSTLDPSLMQRNGNPLQEVNFNTWSDQAVPSWYKDTQLAEEEGPMPSKKKGRKPNRKPKKQNKKTIQNATTIKIEPIFEPQQIPSFVDPLILDESKNINALEQNPEQPVTSPIQHAPDFNELAYPEANYTCKPAPLVSPPLAQLDNSILNSFENHSFYNNMPGSNTETKLVVDNFKESAGSVEVKEVELSEIFENSIYSILHHGNNSENLERSVSRTSISQIIAQVNEDIDLKVFEKPDFVDELFKKQQLPGLDEILESINNKKPTQVELNSREIIDYDYLKFINVTGSAHEK